MNTLDSILSECPPALVERLLAPPQFGAGEELGKVVERLVLEALRTYDALPAEVHQLDHSMVLGALLGSWAAELKLSNFRPLVLSQPGSAPALGATVRNLEALLDERMPVLHRSPVAVLLTAVHLVLHAAPNASREMQAAAIASLLREIEGWLPASLCAQ